MSIFEVFIWAREHKEKVIIVMLVVLLVFFSFAAGYLLSGLKNHPPIVIQKCSY